MPTYERIRLSNIRLENGTRVIPDQTFVFAGQHGLQILENGGGKTSWIHSVLQVVIPNAQLGPRVYKDTVQTKSVGHIAIEWRLDGTVEHYVCTGFCFYNSVERKHELQYYNYVFEYGPHDDYAIASLPFVSDDHEVIGFTELKKFLKEQQDWHVFIPDKNEEYIQYLHRYGIHHEEWRRIQDVNGRESSMDKYFENAKTVETLMERLVVPALEDAIYSAENEKENLLKSFQQFQKNLMDIPHIEQNLREAEIIETHAQKLLSDLSNLKDRVVTYEYSVQHKQQWLKKLALTKEEVEQVIQDLHNNQDRLEDEKESLLQMQQASQIKVEHRETKEAQKVAEQAKHSLSVKESELQKAEYDLRFARANMEYQRFALAESEYQGATAQIEARRATQSELEDMHTQKKQQLEQVVSRFINDYSNQLNEIDVHIEEMKGSQQKENTRKTELLVENEQVKSKYKEVEKWLEETRIHHDALLPLFGPRLTFEPKVLEAEYNALWDAREKGSQQNKRDLENLNTEEKTLDQKEILARSELEIVKIALHDVIQQKRMFEQHSNRVSLVLEPLIRVQGTLFDCESEITIRLASEEMKRKESVQVIREQMASVRKKLSRYDKRDQVIALDEMEMVHDYLKERGVTVEYGVTYIREQDASFREENPQLAALLPYSLLIREGELARVQSLMQRADFALQEIPIWFFVLEKLALDQSLVKTGAFIQVTNSFTIYQPREVLTFVEQAAIAEIVNSLTQELQEVEKTCEQREGELLAVQKAQFSWNDFLRMYSSLPPFEKDLQLLEEAKEEQGQVLLSVQHLLTKCIEHKKALQEQIDIWLNEKNEYSEKIRLLQGYVEREGQLPERNSECEQARERISFIEQSLVEKEASLEKLARGLKWAANQRDHLRDELTKVTAKKAQYHLSDSDCSGDSTVSLATAEREFVAIDEELKQMGRGLVELERECERAKTMMKETEEEITYLCFSLDDLRNHGVPTTSYIVQEREAERNRVQQEKESYSLEWIRLYTLYEKQEKMEQEAIDRFMLEHRIDPLVMETPSIEEIMARLLVVTQTIVSSEKELRLKQTLWNEIDRISAAYETLIVSLMERTEIPIMEEEQQLEWGATWTAQHQRLKEAEESAYREKIVAERRVDEAYDKFRRRMEYSSNSYVSHMLKQLEGLMVSSKRYDYRYVNDRFQESFQAVEAYRKKYEHDLQQRAKDREEIISRFYKRTQDVYEAIMEIPRRSRIEWNEKRMRVVEIDYPWRESEVVRQKLKSHLDGLLRELSTMKTEGQSDQKIQLRIHAQLQTSALMSAIAPFSTCTFKVAKPLNDANIVQPILYQPWEKVHVWSGAQKYFGYMAVFVSLLSAVRMRLTGSPKSWKVIVADNPFGTASSTHILEPLLAMCDANFVQLICLTAIRDEEIIKHFKVVYSNRYFGVGSTEVLQSKLETRPGAQLRSLFADFSDSHEEEK